LYGIE